VGGIKLGSYKSQRHPIDTGFFVAQPVGISRDVCQSPRVLARVHRVHPCVDPANRHPQTRTDNPLTDATEVVQERECNTSARISRRLVRPTPGMKLLIASSGTGMKKRSPSMSVLVTYSPPPDPSETNSSDWMS